MASGLLMARCQILARMRRYNNKSNNSNGTNTNGNIRHINNRDNMNNNRNGNPPTHRWSRMLYPDARSDVPATLQPSQVRSGTHNISQELAGTRKHDLSGSLQNSHNTAPLPGPLH